MSLSVATSFSSSSDRFIMFILAQKIFLYIFGCFFVVLQCNNNNNNNNNNINSNNNSNTSTSTTTTTTTTNSSNNTSNSCHSWQFMSPLIYNTREI